MATGDATSEAEVDAMAGYRILVLVVTSEIRVVANALFLEHRTAGLRSPARLMTASRVKRMLVIMEEKMLEGREYQIAKMSGKNVVLPVTQ